MDLTVIEKARIIIHFYKQIGEAFTQKSLAEMFDMKEEEIRLTTQAAGYHNGTIPARSKPIRPNSSRYNESNLLHLAKIPSDKFSKYRHLLKD